jgi:hypothetical protein
LRRAGKYLVAFVRISFGGRQKTLFRVLALVYHLQKQWRFFAHSNCKDTKKIAEMQGKLLIFFA